MSIENFKIKIFSVFEKVLLSFGQEITSFKNQIMVDSLLYSSYSTKIQQIQIEEIVLYILELNEDLDPNLEFSIKFLNILEMNYLFPNDLKEIKEFLEGESSPKTQFLVECYICSLIPRFQHFILFNLLQIFPLFTKEIREWCLKAFYYPGCFSKYKEKMKLCLSTIQKYQNELKPFFQYEKIIFYTRLEEKENLVEKRKKECVFLTSLIIIFIKKAKYEFFENQNLDNAIEFLHGSDLIIQKRFEKVLKHYKIYLDKLLESEPYILLESSEANIIIEILIEFLLVYQHQQNDNLLKRILNNFHEIYSFCSISLKYKSMKVYLQTILSVPFQSKHLSKMIQFIHQEKVYMIHSSIKSIKYIQPVVERTIIKYPLKWIKYIISLSECLGNKYDLKINLMIQEMIKFKNEEIMKQSLVYLLTFTKIFDRLSNETRKLLK